MPADTPPSPTPGPVPPLLILESPDWLAPGPPATPPDDELPPPALLDHIWSLGISAPSPSQFLSLAIPELASELGTPWLAVVARQPDWSLVAEFGRRPLPVWPQALLAEAAHRRQPGHARIRTGDLSLALAVIPLPPFPRPAAHNSGSGLSGGGHSTPELATGGHSLAASAPGGNSPFGPPSHHPAGGDATPLILLGATRGTLVRSLPAWASVARPLGFGLQAALQREAALNQARSAQLALQTVAQLDSSLDRDTLLERFLNALGDWLSPASASLSFWSRADGELWRYAWPNPPLFPLRVAAADQPWLEAWKQGQPFRREPSPPASPSPAAEPAPTPVDSEPGTTGTPASGSREPTGWWLGWPLVTPAGEPLAMFDIRFPPGTAVDSTTGQLLTEVAQAVARTLAAERERYELSRHQQQLTDQFARHVQLVGESPPMASLRGTVDQLAATDLAVLLLGERGTGREMVAKALHYQGRRRQRPFVAVNCAGGDPTELLVELFGQEADPDAVGSWPADPGLTPPTTPDAGASLGQIELADGGTLFVDEIADLGADGQAGLLRLLDERQVFKVGSRQGVRVDVRVVAGSSLPLPDLVKSGRLREDLALRLGVVSVELPPLRDRPADVLPLAEFFLARFARQMGRPGLVLSAAARDRLTAHAWPGNVRELRNLMERVACLSTTPEVRPEDLSFAISPERDSTLDAGEPGLSEATNQFQAGYIRRTIGRVGGNMSEAARLLELHRSNLYRKMRQLGMELPRGETETGG